MKISVDFDRVHEVLGHHMLADGMDIVWDHTKSHGSWLVDGKTGREYLDFFSFFATNPIGHNHPMISKGEAAEELARVAIHNPSNSDIYTREMAEFVETFWNTTVPEGFKYSFFVAGGALAVENALKAAFDWKVRKNLARGMQGEVGHKVIHFREAFHGRSGYTLSLTNTLPDKYRYFPRFNWPRVSNPKVMFPIEEHMGDIISAEQRAVQEIKQAFVDYPNEIAAILIEPIQGEGGDNHFRPEFFKQLRQLADENEAMLIFDEVQTGLGLTGTWWMLEQTSVVPDMFVFGKKTQVCGFVCGPRIDEIPENVFHTSSRINSTWGGNLVDMVRAKHYIRIIEEEKMLDNVNSVGELLLGGLQEIHANHRKLVSNPRASGLMGALTIRNPETRKQLLDGLYEQGVMMLPCGNTSIRVRPSLNISAEEMKQGLGVMGKVLKGLK